MKKILVLLSVFGMGQWALADWLVGNDANSEREEAFTAEESTVPIDDLTLVDEDAPGENIEFGPGVRRYYYYRGGYYYSGPGPSTVGPANHHLTNGNFFGNAQRNHNHLTNGNWFGKGGHHSRNESSVDGAKLPMPKVDLNP